MSNNFKIINTEEEFWDCLELRTKLEFDCILEPNEQKQEEITLLNIIIDMWEFRQEIREIEESGDYEIDPHIEWKQRWNERLKQQMRDELEREFWEEEMRLMAMDEAAEEDSEDEEYDSQAKCN